MKKVIESKEFQILKNVVNEFVPIVNEVGKTTDLDPKIINILNDCYKPVNGSDGDILLHYETLQQKLSEFQIIKKDEVIKKCQDNFNMLKNVVKQMDELSKFINQITTNEQLDEVINREIILNERIKVTKNDLVDKIFERKQIIFNKEINDKKNTMHQKCDTIEETYFKDKEIQENIIPSTNKLKEWSGKQNCSVIFDSKIDGDGGNNVLMNKVIDKKNLYFISFDYENNVFGGYVDTIINKTNSWIINPNSFTFSLMRNRKMKNEQYKIKNDYKQDAFQLYSNYDYLYAFGNHSPDIFVTKIDNSNSYCGSNSYEHKDDQKPFRDNKYPTTFETKRILVIQMS
ncbi:TLDc domain-containing protein [Entamoeba marina]